MLAKLTRGQTKISASAFNSVVEAAQQALDRRPWTKNQSPQRSERSPAIVTIRNDAEVAVDRFGVLGINGPLFHPDTALSAFTDLCTLKGVVPDDGLHTGRFVILTEPLLPGAIGKAVVAGVTPVRIFVPDADHEYLYADVDDGNATRLLAATSGIAQILWREGGTGLQWAMVRLGGGGGGGVVEAPAGAISLCLVTLHDGYGGSGSSAPTYRYDLWDTSHDDLLKDVDGADTAPKQPMFRPTEFGYYRAADDWTPGLVYVGQYGKWQLLSCGEVLMSSACKCYSV